MISSITSILFLASLDTGTIADGSTVIELGLTDAHAGGCLLEVDATDYESGAASWPICPLILNNKSHSSLDTMLLGSLFKEAAKWPQNSLVRVGSTFSMPSSRS